jgi:hypothetical protein
LTLKREIAEKQQDRYDCGSQTVNAKGVDEGNLQVREIDRKADTNGGINKRS